jgi:hypothetical protein
VYSNFITPPDSLTEAERHTVLIVDSDWPEIEAVALFCKESKKFYNVHVYRAEMDNEVWLVEQAEKSEFVIINTVDTAASKIKDRLVEQPNAFYYGPKNFLTNDRKLGAPVEFFVEFDKKENPITE